MTLLRSRESTVSRYAPRGFPSAVVTLVPAQRAALVVAVCTLAGFLLAAPRATLIAINATITLFYLINAVYRVGLVDLSLRHRPEICVDEGALAGGDSADWPSYLVLVPLYREGAILPALVQALSRLDYPKDRLDIRLLVEADDEETMAAARQLSLPSPFQVVSIPVSEPRTKPKACNVGMHGSDADLVVIYDAEDRPDPDQLRKAAVAFQGVPPRVACIQAKLGFYNTHRNLLTRWFTAEYAMWFDLCMPALDGLHAPIPLGGTSNHFRREVLESVGAWDEYNVTEDCDLGLRLYVAGWRTRMLDSTTWEQACPSLPNWIRQRSRWVKGYMQTYFVHMRAPASLHRRLGWAGSAHFHLLIGGTPVFQLVNPAYWMLALGWFVVRPESISAYFPGVVFAMAALCLFAGNFALAYSAAIACVRRGHGKLAGYGLAMPFYWAMMSLAAWKALLQLIHRPHYWEKTQHLGEDIT